MSDLIIGAIRADADNCHRYNACLLMFSVPLMIDFQILHLSNAIQRNRTGLNGLPEAAGQEKCAEQAVAAFRQVAMAERSVQTSEQKNEDDEFGSSADDINCASECDCSSCSGSGSVSSNCTGERPDKDRSANNNDGGNHLLPAEDQAQQLRSQMRRRSVSLNALLDASFVHELPATGERIIVSRGERIRRPRQPTASGRHSRRSRRQGSLDGDSGAVVDSARRHAKGRRKCRIHCRRRSAASLSGAVPFRPFDDVLRDGAPAPGKRLVVRSQGRLDEQQKRTLLLEFLRRSSTVMPIKPTRPPEDGSREGNSGGATDDRTCKPAAVRQQTKRHTKPIMVHYDLATVTNDAMATARKGPIVLRANELASECPRLAD